MHQESLFGDANSKQNSGEGAQFERRGARTQMYGNKTFCSK